MRTPVIIDTDVALDDWMAILYLLMNPTVDVIGITTTGVGAAHLTPGTTIVLKLLQAAGQPAIPVAMGAQAPLLYSNVFPGSWRQTVDSAYGLTLPENRNSRQGVDAGSLITSLLNGSPTKVTILSIGGGTNLGALLAEQPALVSKIDRIVVMGGAINVPGNVNGFNPDYSNVVAEWNIFIDPLGAQNMFSSGAPITLVPLDACNQVPLDLSFYDQLQTYIQGTKTPTPAALIIYQGLTTQLSTIKENQYFFWDPLAAVALTNGNFLAMQPMNLLVNQILCEEKDSSGLIYSDPSGPAITVAMGADAARVKSQFFNVITGSATL